MKERGNFLEPIVVPGPHNNEAEIFLVGANHLWPALAIDVKDMLTSVQPDVVFVELCHRRSSMMLPATDQDKAEAKIEEEIDPSTPVIGRVPFFR